MKELLCTVCPNGCHLCVDPDNSFSVTGNACPRGAIYARTELTAPCRILTGTVRIRGAIVCRCPVRTSVPIPLSALRSAADALQHITLDAPTKQGQIVCADFQHLGAALIVTRKLSKITG
jgi:CxxC motif-containing protein